MLGKVKEILLDRDRIATRVCELGDEISRDYAGKEIFAICLLKGSMVFAADLIRQIRVPIEMDTLRASSYGNSTVSSGNVKIHHDLDSDMSGKHVLIIEDIVDTGHTLAKILQFLQTRGPASLKICSLLSKPSRREVEVPLDYIGFQIEDHFVVGYGLDYGEFHRQWPDIGILDPNA